MPAITIRDVPDETRSELAARAARSGRSLQEYLRRELIQMAERPDHHTVMERVRARKAAMGNGPTTEQILAYRDMDRR